MWGCGGGGDSAVQPHSMGGVRGGKRHTVAVAQVGGLAWDFGQLGNFLRWHDRLVFGALEPNLFDDLPNVHEHVSIESVGVAHIHVLDVTLKNTLQICFSVTLGFAPVP